MTNREPVMRLDEDAVVPATTVLRRHGSVLQIQPMRSRVTRFEYLLDEKPVVLPVQPQKTKATQRNSLCGLRLSQ
jgi:uncharacterized protein YceH (UPF0502 family)